MCDIWDFLWMWIFFIFESVSSSCKDMRDPLSSFYQGGEGGTYISSWHPVIPHVHILSAAEPITCFYGRDCQYPVKHKSALMSHEVTFQMNPLIHLTPLMFLCNTEYLLCYLLGWTQVYHRPTSLQAPYWYYIWFPDMNHILQVFHLIIQLAMHSNK